MLCSIATDHINTVRQYFLSSKHGSIHPTSSLFHQHNHTIRSICEGFSVWYVGECVCLLSLDIDLETHNPIFGKILICFCTGWDFLSCYILEESIKWFTFDCFPSKHAISSWQHLGESKECFSCLVRSVTKLILEELGSLDQVT